MKSAFASQFERSAMIGISSQHSVSGLRHFTKDLDPESADPSATLNHVILGDEGVTPPNNEQEPLQTASFTRHAQVVTESSQSLFCGVENFELGESIQVPVDGQADEYLTYQIEDKTNDHHSDIVELKLVRYLNQHITKPGLFS